MGCDSLDNQLLAAYPTRMYKFLPHAVLSDKFRLSQAECDDCHNLVLHSCLLHRPEDAVVSSEVRVRTIASETLKSVTTVMETQLLLCDCCANFICFNISSQWLHGPRGKSNGIGFMFHGSLTFSLPHYLPEPNWPPSCWRSLRPVGRVSHMNLSH